MKKALLAILFLAFASVCFADVTAEIIGKDFDEQGNIIIKTQFKVDGVEIVSRYPKLDGKYYFVNRYTAVNFYNMTDEQIIAKIKGDLSQHAKMLIGKKFLAVENAKMALDDVVGSTITEKTSTVQISPVLELEVKTDGSKIEKVITPTIIE